MKYITLWLCLLLGCYSAPVLNNKQKLKKARSYLKQFGYLSENYGAENKNIKKKMLSSAVVEFQNFAGMNMTGKIDNAVMDMMNMPRCGVKDMKEGVKKKRYVIFGTQWEVKNLKFYIKDYSTKLKKDVIKSTISNAFNIWSKYIDLNFKEVEHETEADFIIGFYKKKHYESYFKKYNKFDGKGGVLAHAFFPTVGEIHFDDDEDWSVTKNTDLYEVAAHEIGHALGLDHSDNTDSIMTPFYRGYNSFFKTQLDQDDIDGITAIYGERMNTTMKPHKTMCSFEKINSIFYHDNTLHIIDTNSLFLYKNKKWVDYKINKYWNKLPKESNYKAFSYSNKYFLFSGNKYWRYNEQKMDGNYPKNISDVFVGIPNYIDAAMSWKNNAYFFKGNKYWVYNNLKNPRVMPTFPKLISDDFDGLPSGLNAITYAKNTRYIYAFKNDEVYYFNTNTNKLTGKQFISDFLQCN